MIMDCQAARSLLIRQCMSLWLEVQRSREEKSGEHIISRSTKRGSATQGGGAGDLSWEDGRHREREGRKIEDGVCGERLFPLNFVPQAEAESKDGGFGGWGGWGRLNIKKIREDRYLYLSTWVFTWSDPRRSYFDGAGGSEWDMNRLAFNLCIFFLKQLYPRLFFQSCFCNLRRWVKYKRESRACQSVSDTNQGKKFSTRHTFKRRARTLHWNVVRAPSLH